MKRKIEQFIYPGKVKIISLPKRQLSSESEYPELIGLEGKIATISGNSVGVVIEGKYNKHSQFGWYWFNAECIEKRSEETLENFIREKSVDEGFLQDWYQNSVSPEQKPVWSDEHISEVYNDFYLIPKESVDGKN